MTQHLVKCESELGNEDRRLKLEDTEILASTQRGSMVLLTLEAIWIRELAPSINTKDEFRSGELTIRWLLGSLATKHWNLGTNNCDY